MPNSFVWHIAMCVMVLSRYAVRGQVSYSIPEEMTKGSRVGNISQDLGLDVKRLRSGKARIFTGDNAEYIGLNEKGILHTEEKIDRETLCGKTTPCALHLQLILENPMELYKITVEITDINDNAPSFPKGEIHFEISESAVTGARFMLENAIDLDVGVNSLLSYSLQPTDNFILSLQSLTDSEKNMEMVLQNPLDREGRDQFSLLLTAVDGGEPPLSSTVRLYVTVLDNNDNAPVFTQKVYKATIPENSPTDSVITFVSATDADEGSNGIVTYFMLNTGDFNDLFMVDGRSGQIALKGIADFEKASRYQLNIQARDQGGLSDSCKVIIDLTDVNDNKPVINILSISNSISEASSPGTVVAMLNINDLDSGVNGQVHCHINNNIPFDLTSPSSGFFSLQTEQELDRERTIQYDIIVTCTDGGIPALSSSVSLSVQLSDVNDNAPVFEKNNYETYVVENNTPGVSIFTVKASDSDWNQNARVTYVLEDSTFNGVSVSSYASVHPDSGEITTMRSFDYEQLKDFTFKVKAQDGGSPPLSSNVTIKIIIRDQNDNAPQVLYPVQTGGSLVTEIVPRSADVGYLVTKVVAVDVDSGQNAWLSYKLQKAKDRALFEVGLQNGEIRTVRQVTDKDAVKQKLTVVVEDNGQPSRSAVVTINVAVADSLPEILYELTDLTHEKEFNYNLTFYLILALAAVTFLFITCLVVIISVKIYKWRQSRILYQPNLPVIPYYAPNYTDTGITGTLPHGYNYEVCMTTDSRKSDCKFSTLGGKNVVVMEPSFTETMQRVIAENNVIGGEYSTETVRALCILQV